MGFLTALTDFESGNQNIPNTTKGTSSGQAQGNFQITTGTWNDFAPDAGVDLREYPTPMSAPLALQWKVASTIPLHRWAPETLNYLKERGYQLAPDLSLGQNVAANGGSPAKWFSGAPYAGSTSGTPAYLSGSGNASVDPFAEFAAAEKIAAGVAPTNAIAKGPAYLSPAPAGNDPFSEFEQPPAQSMQNMTMTGQTGTSSGPENFNVTPAGVAANPGMSANTNLGLTGLREQAAQAAGATSPASAPDSTMTAPGGGLDVMNSMPVVGPAILAAGAGVNALLNGDSYAQERALQAQQMQQFEAQHPTAATGARIGGNILGAAPLMAASPLLMGAGTGSFLGDMAMGGVSNALLNTADTAARGNLTGNGLATAAAEGLGSGMIGGTAGNLIGRGAGILANKLSGASPAAISIANSLRDAGMTPDQAANVLRGMPQEATLADLDPALTTKAGALAAVGGKPTSILKNAMLGRAAGANDRVSQAVDTLLGPRPDLTVAQEGIRAAASRQAAPFYQAATATPGSMNISPVLAYIDGQLPNAAGGVKTALQTAKSLLVNQNGGFLVPKDDPQALLGARQALDDMIQRGGADTTAGKNSIGQLNAVRSQVNQVLKTDPNIAAGDAVYSSHMQDLGALNGGTELFKPSTRIEDVQRSVAQMTPSQLSAYQQGALSAIHDALDNAPQGDYSRARQLFGKSTANRAKLDALFPNSGQMLDTIAGEAGMRETEQAVARGSQTAERQAAQQEFMPSSGRGSAASDIVLPLLAEGAGGNIPALATMGAKAAFNSLTEGLASGARNRLTASLAQMLSATGPARNNALAQVANAYRTGDTNALVSRGAGGLANLLGSRSAAEIANRLYGPHQANPLNLPALSGAF